MVRHFVRTGEEKRTAEFHSRLEVVPVVERQADIQQPIPNGKRSLMLPLAVHQKTHHHVHIPLLGKEQLGTIHTYHHHKGDAGQGQTIVF